MTARRAPLLLLFVLVALLAGWWWYSEPGAPTAPPPAGVNASGGSEAADVASTPAVAQGGIAAPTEQEVAAIRELVQELEDVESGKQPVTIQVWDRVEGQAAADAEVFVMDSVEADWEITRGPFAQHWSSVAERRGRRFRTDEAGRVEVQRFARNSVVVAKATGAYAFKWVGEVAAEGHVEVLTLEADESVTIQVVDQQGAPVAGAAVGVVERIPIGGSYEELQARAEQFETWVTQVRQWARDNPKGAEGARAKLGGLESGLREARRDARLAKAEMERRARLGASADQGPLARVEVRTRRLTDQDGLAVIDHFQLYRRADERGAKQQAKAGGKAKGKQAAAGRGKGGARAGGKGALRGKGGGRGKGTGKGGAKGGKGGKGGFAAPKLPSTFEAALLMPLTAPVARQITVDPLPEGVIVLQKPPTAALALRTVDRDGRPFTHPVRGQLELVGDELSAWTRVMLRKEQNERTIEFPHVGLGLLLQAACRLDDDDFRWRTGELRGPVAADERLEVDLVVAPDAGMLYAQLVGDGGAPLAGVRPSFLITSQGGRLEGEEVVTDADGRFHLPYRVREGQQGPYRFEVRLDDAVPTRGFAAPLARLPVATVTDLGELVLSDLSAFARGVVVDDAGAPVAGASLQLERARFEQGRSEPRFVDQPFVRTETAEDGSFHLFGDFEPGRYRLRVEMREHFRTFAEVADGDDLRVELTRKCRVVGTVLAPEWMNRKRVRVELLPVAVSAPPGEELQPREDQLRDHEGSTYAFFDWVRPGTYDVAFRLQGFPDAFLVVDRLVLEPGQVAVHPRLKELDLGAYIYRFEIYPVDQNGESVSVNRPQLAKVTRRDGRQQYIGLVMKGGYGEVFNTAPELEVVPMMGGYVADTQVLAPGRSELVFQRVPPVDVVLQGLSALAGDLPVHVQLQRLENGDLPDSLEAYDGMSQRIAGWYRITRHGTGRLDELDTARVQVTAGGAHKVVLQLGPLKRSPQTVELDAVELALEPGGDAPRVVVPFDVQAVQQALETARAALEAGSGAGK